MHFERLVIEAGEATLALDLHRRFTVVAGAGEAERAGLGAELIAALGRGRPGVHAELRTDAGGRLAVFRPPGQRHRVVDVERALDVSHRYTDADGRVNLLGRSALGARAARRLVLLDEADLTVPAQEDVYVGALGQVDQGRLWDVAHKVLDRRRDLEDIHERTGAAFDDPRTVAEIERRHRTVERIESDYERIRGVTFLAASAAALAIVPAAAFGTTLLALALTGLALVCVAVSFQYWRQLVRATAEERAVLAEAGASTYLAFQIQRVNGLVVSDSQRRQLVRSEEALRAALAEWRLLAGDVGVEWALEHRDAVTAANRRLRAAAGIRSAMVLHLRPEQATAAALSHVLVERLDTLRTAGPDGESVPLLLDDTLRNVRPDAKPILLGQLARASATQQVVYLTEDPDVIAWARLEAVAGQVAVVEPATAERRRGATDPSAASVV